jgi:hypothetical protein
MWPLPTWAFPAPEAAGEAGTSEAVTQAAARRLSGS